MPETILLAFLYAKLKGNKVSVLFSSWTIYPLVIFEIITFIEQVMSFCGSYTIIESINKLTSIYLIFYLLLVFKYELYIPSIIGSIFIVLGGALNDIVIKANGGFMPVYQSISYLTGRFISDESPIKDNIHILGTSEANLKFLTDFIDLGYTILSIGDVLMRIFVFLIIYGAIKKINNQRRKESC
ncbi:hypothetical protein EHW71_10195 [Clostridium butyricum]|uniref:DUF5317 family protein n=1 Tax=Clostridium butyricum TaxID=1492 RepID=UPI000F51D1BA|nr:DUF5317 family protein [Clostridium butyricum]MDU4799599.1 DUF5317 family protein [Clostridium butyricum]RQN10493.1 hypothetical protein EHW71_10195 [Clostridium butyricum]